MRILAEIEKTGVHCEGEASTGSKPIISVDFNIQQKFISTLVIGASGFIGGKTLEELIARDSRTISYDKIKPKKIGRNI